MKASDSEHTSRVQRKEWRRRRRRRRLFRGAVKLMFWTLVLAGVFVMGIGFGKTLGGGPGGSGSQVTLEAERGQVTVTQPVTTVVQTKTVVKRAPSRQRAGRR